ncbi:MAG: hypothetical protein D6785_10355, partial [Planctomycetota bacterium]
AWVEYLGAPFLTSFGEVNIRGKYADWQGGDLFLSLHTNAGGGQGTSSFIHSYAPSRGSKAFQTILHNQLVQDIRKTFNPHWRDRGKKKANFGELRNTRTMPAVLVEVAFHDHPQDALLLRNQRFRHLVGRSLYKGISKYLSGKKVVSPLPPVAFQARNSGPRQVTLSWKAQKDPLEPKSKAKGFIVYASSNGFGFDNGRIVYSNSYTFRDLVPGAVYYFRVSAFNQGGESLGSEVLSVRVTPPGKKAKILVVQGFDRMDRFSTYKKREYNTRNYVIYHGEALASSGFFYDSISNEALMDHPEILRQYRLLDWILGEESTKDETFSAKEQEILAGFLKKGGKFLVSGSEIGWDLDQKGSTEDKKFYRTYLKAKFVEDKSGTSKIRGKEGTLWKGLSLSLDDGTHGTYNVDYPDVILPMGGARAFLTYENLKVAGIGYQGRFRLVYLAFPFETVYPKQQRNLLMKRILFFLMGG